MNAVRKYSLLLIVAFAAFLRFYQLGLNPPSLTWDEAAWGYNAYSLGIDGRDEFGRFLPLDYLESFGDFKPVVYAYLTILPVKIFGLNEFAVRFPSALLGTLTVLVTYLLVKRIFLSGTQNSILHWRIKNQNHSLNLKTNFDKVELIALLSSFLLAISPWHIMLSRAAFEANVATFFIVTGVWLFLNSIQGNKWLIVFSVGFFVASIYTFNAARIVSPILLILLSLVFWRTLWKIKYQTLVAIVIGIVLVIPIVRFLVTPQASLRFKEVNIFSDIGIIERTNQEIENDNNTLWSKVLHNRRFVYAAEYLRHYLDHFNPNFLFIKGDGNPKFSTQDVGQMYLWELPFFIAGILFLFKRREGNWWIVPVWLLIGIIPAATARETPHALRIEAALPTFQIITAIGVIAFINMISNIPPSLKLWRASKYFKFFIVVFIFSLLFFNFSYHIHGYYVHYPREYSGEWQYGYKESVEYVRSVENSYNQIFITSDLGRPYIYYLFYTKTDPRIFREDSVIKRDPFGFVTVEGFGKYHFADHIVKGQKKGESLYIQTPKKIPPKSKKLKNFYLLNNDISLIAYE